MRKTFLAVLLSLAFAPAVQGTGRIEQATMPSRLLATEKPYSIYLPEGYDASSARYPVLYLLHGAFGDNTNWHELGRVLQTADSLTAAGVIEPVVIVMPDARGTNQNRAGEHMGYFNVEGWPYEDYFFQELIPYIEKNYRVRTDRCDRAIAGLSMGGGGAVVYGQHHPDLFSAVYSMSGLLDDFPRRSVSPSYSVPFLWSVVATSPVDNLTLADEQTLERYRSVRWWVDCGDDDFLYLPNVHFYMKMKERGIPIEFRMRDGGHSWNYWRSSLPEALKWSFPAGKR